MSVHECWDCSHDHFPKDLLSTADHRLQTDSVKIALPKILVAHLAPVIGDAVMEARRHKEKQLVVVGYQGGTWRNTDSRDDTMLLDDEAEGCGEERMTDSRLKAFYGGCWREVLCRSRGQPKLLLV